MYETQITTGAYQGQIGNAVQGINYPSTPKASVTAEIIGRLENINALLRDVALNQRNLLDRLHGPRPEPSNEIKASQLPNGALNTIEERLNWLLSSAQEVNANQQTLDRLA